MKVYKLLAVLGIVVMLMACSGIQVISDYDTKADFAGMKTYDWMPIPKKMDLSELNVNRIKNAVNAELAKKGLTQTSENPDFAIAVYFGVKEKVNVIDSGGFGYGYRGSYWGGSVHVQQYEEGMLVLDFVDVKNKSMFWRGAARKKMKDIKSPEKREKAIQEVVRKILAKYPPK